MELDTKTKRVQAILSLLEEAECSSSEIVRRLRLNSNQLRTVQRYLSELELQGEIECVEGRYRRRRKPSQLNPIQALAVYSATRMLFHHAAEYNEHYLSALEKLTRELPEPARRVASQANEVYKARRGGKTSLAFEVAARCWLEGKVLKTQYRSQRRTSPLELEIYFIEVSPRNREAYAIGINQLKEGNGQPYVYRLGRMQNPVMTSTSYEIPDDFHPMRFLANAWGIMPGDPTRVELFFSPAVKERIREENFSGFLEMTPLSSGHTRLILEVGNTLELVPWILGWGGEVEVVSPPKLRAQVAEALQKGAALYGSPAGGI